MTLHRAPSRSWTLAPTVILIAGFAYGLRATVLGGFIAWNYEKDGQALCSEIQTS